MVKKFSLGNIETLPDILKALSEIEDEINRQNKEIEKNNYKESLSPEEIREIKEFLKKERKKAEEKKAKEKENKKPKSNDSFEKFSSEERKGLKKFLGSKKK